MTPSQTATRQTATQLSEEEDFFANTLATGDPEIFDAIDRKSVV